MSEWKSHVLNIYDSPDHCKVCKFIDGDRSEDVMLETIRILDASLADTTAHAKSLQDIVVHLLDKDQRIQPNRPSEN